MTHSSTLFVLQHAVIIWFMLDFFLARESTTANKLYSENLARSGAAANLIERINSTANALETDLTCDNLIYKKPTFDKVILNVVDALGSEFITSISNVLHRHNDDANKGPSRMPFVESSLAHHSTMGFIARAATPTVTMPRIKALVSGTIPSFMDVAYNLASDVSAMHEDNLLDSAKSSGKSLVFYGDDTWISLFGKSTFKRYRETLSLYASDYTSVDTNVTEMAIPETTRDNIDWDFLILHYLGLDHLGHIFGTNQSPLIDKKLAEMDSVIEKLYTNMALKDLKTLLITCGDHGMSSEGNHGGDSALESQTAMLFTTINRNFEDLVYDGEIQIAQVDLAVTVALLTGLPIPKLSRGVVIEPLLNSLWKNDPKHMMCASIYNLKQLSSLLEDDEFQRDNGLGIHVLDILNRLAANSTDENKNPLIKQSLNASRAIQAHLLMMITSRSNSYLVVLAVTFVMLLSIISMRRACNRLLMPLMSNSERLTCLSAVLFPVFMLNSTDFIEAEHIFWPIYSIIIFILFCLVALQTHSIKSINRDIEWLRVTLFVVTFLITVTWNHWLRLGHQNLGWSLPIVSILMMCNFTRQTTKVVNKSSALFFLFGLVVLGSKFAEETLDDHYLVAMLQMLSLFLLIVHITANIHISFKMGDSEATSIVQKLATSWMWWVFLIARSRNYVFIMSNVVMEASLNKLSNSLHFNPIMRAITYLQFANSAFYCQGNTNLFTSLDVRPAFFGQTKYNILLAVPLLACSTFGCQIYWYIKLFQRVQGETEQESMDIKPKVHYVINTSKLIPEGTKDAIKDFVDMRNFLTIAYFAFVCMVLRDHLFIWSVISPKLVYLFMTTLTIRLVTTTISHLPQMLTKVFAGGHNSIKYNKLDQ